MPRRHDDKGFISPKASPKYPHQIYCHAGDPKKAAYHQLFLGLETKNQLHNDKSFREVESDALDVVSDDVNDDTNTSQVEDALLSVKDEQPKCGIKIKEPSRVYSPHRQLQNLRENIFHCHYSRGSYIRVVDSLVATGVTLSTREVLDMLGDILQSNSFRFINRVGFFLHQDSLLRTDLSFDRNSTWDIMKRSLIALDHYVSQFSNGLVTPGLLAGNFVLEYLLRIFIKDLKSTGCANLLENVFSLSSKWSRHEKLLDTVFCLLEFAYSEQNSFSKCLNTLYKLTVLPVVTCQSEIERQDVLVKLARTISQHVDKLSDFSNKYSAILYIPSCHLREKVIDIHLESYFALSGTDSVSGREKIFSLSKFKNVHLKKIPFRPDGTKQDLKYFLRLLTVLLQSHLLILTGAPLVSFFPGIPESFKESAISVQDLKEARVPLAELTDRLSSDPSTSIDLTEPTNWYHLELLMTLTS